MTIPTPRDPFSEVVDKDRRWTPEWYSWLQQFVSTAGGVAISGVPVAGQLAQWTNPTTIQGFTAPYAPLASPVFTGDPKAPTPAAGDNDTSIATTAFVTASNTYLNILAYGGVGDGATDNTTALSAAVAALGSRGGTIFFPRGSYAFASLQTIGYTLNALYDVTLLGDGVDATWLLWPAGVDGLKINFNSNTSVPVQSFHLRDLSIVSADTTPSQIGLNLNQLGSLNGAYVAYTEITRVVFMGSNGPVGSQGWGTCCLCTDVSNVQFVGCSFFGTSGTPTGKGVSWTGVSTSIVPTGLYFTDCELNQFNIGVEMLAFVQGLYLTSCQVNGCLIGVDLVGTSGTPHTEAAVGIVNCEFGVYHTNANAVSMTNPVAFLQIDGCNFNTSSTIVGPSGFIALTTTKNVQITNNVLIAAQYPGSGSAGTKLTGISLAGTEPTTGTIISNNTIAGFFGNGTGVNASVPLVIQATAHDVIVCNNYFIGNQFVAGVSTCINNSGGVNCYFSDNFYDSGFGPATTAYSGDQLKIKSNQASEIIGNVNNAFALNVGNQNNTTSDHGVAVFAGASTAADASTIFIDFLDASANLCGSITRNDTGSVRGVSFNGNAIDIQGGITVSNLFASVTGAFQLNIGNKHGSAGDHAANCYAGNNTTSDTSSVFFNFLTANGNQCGAIVRNDTGAVRQVTYNTTSDKRLKENIRDSHRGLITLQSMRVVEYGPDEQRAQGLIAQEVDEVYPEAVKPGNEERPWMMDYGRITPLLVQAIKDLAIKVELLETELRSR